MSTMTCDVCRGPVTYGQLRRGYDSVGGAGKLKAPRRGWRHWRTIKWDDSSSV